MNWRSTRLLGAVLCSWAAFTTSCTPGSPQPNNAPVRAESLITAADDFIVDVYHKGIPVPDSDRQVLLERFGATVERIAVQARQGDWLAFHVVNDRLRWGGVYYFAVAGGWTTNGYGFVSELRSGAWSACDDPTKAARFIRDKTFMSDNKASPVERPWQDGSPLMKQFAGSTWNGEPVWGQKPSTWIKVIVP